MMVDADRVVEKLSAMDGGTKRAAEALWQSAERGKAFGTMDQHQFEDCMQTVHDLIERAKGIRMAIQVVEGLAIPAQD